MLLLFRSRLRHAFDFGWHFSMVEANPSLTLFPASTLRMKPFRVLVEPFVWPTKITLNRYQEVTPPQCDKNIVINPIQEHGVWSMKGPATLLIFIRSLLSY